MAGHCALMKLKRWRPSSSIGREARRTQYLRRRLMHRRRPPRELQWQPPASPILPVYSRLPCRSFPLFAATQPPARRFSNSTASAVMAQTAKAASAAAWQSPGSRSRPDLTIRATLTQGIAGTAMQPWAVSAGGPLREQEIRQSGCLHPATTGGVTTAGSPRAGRFSLAGHRRPYAAYAWCGRNRRDRGCLRQPQAPPLSAPDQIMRCAYFGCSLRHASYSARASSDSG